MKANKVIVSFNNGSVPPQYAYRYQIIFSEQTEDAELTFFRGYDRNEETILSDTRKFNPDVLQQLLSLLNKENNAVKNPDLVGGSQRIIDINSEKVVIDADDDAGIALFNRFLYLYSPDFSNIINKHINQ